MTIRYTSGDNPFYIERTTNKWFSICVDEIKSCPSQLWGLYVRVFSQTIDKKSEIPHIYLISLCQFCHNEFR